MAFAAAARGAELPQTHAYQKTLRSYLQTLQEEDFAVEVKPFTLAGVAKTDEERYRFHLLNAFAVDFRQGLFLPPEQFTLASIEGGDGILVPPISGSHSGIYSLAWLLNWDYPGNPYRGSRPLQRRAFTLAAVDLMMHDHAHEVQRIGTRSDYLGGTLLWLAEAYRASRDAVPAEARAAYEEGLEKFVRRIDGWGPTGAMVDMDLFAAVSMRMAADLLAKPEISAMAETYVKRLFSDQKYFHPAGYFVDGGCFDTSYNGISLFFAVWAGLQAPDWPFIGDALDKAYKLKAHLTFPEPDGKAFGPSSMSSRTSACPPYDQWNFPPRNVGAAMMTDAALFLVDVPHPEVFADAEQRRIDAINKGLAGAFKASPPNPWREAHWGPRPNFAYDHYRQGFYRRLQALQRAKSSLLVNPFQRTGNFVETFEKTFLVAKLGPYAFAVHTGPVGRGLHGWGGGALCAFWTPQTGSVMLGRRRGWAKQTQLGDQADTYDGWRMWPVHAVTGLTREGAIFSSAKIVDPQPVFTTGGARAEIAVSGTIPREPSNTPQPCLAGEVTYSRRFRADVKGLTVETTIAADGKDYVTELYETIPVFLHESRLQAASAPTAIFFQEGLTWKEATPTIHQQVRAIRLERFNGAVRITFASPQRVKLSPEVWSDHYQSRVACRTILIDLLNTDEGVAVPVPQRQIRYTITADTQRGSVR